MANRTWLLNSAWTLIHFQLVLRAYRHAPQLFDNVFFERLIARRDKVAKAYWRLTMINSLLSILLAITAFGVVPKFRHMGLELRVDLLKEFMLFIMATLQLFLGAIFNDLASMKALLKAHSVELIDRVSDGLDKDTQATGKWALNLTHADPTDASIFQFPVPKAMETRWDAFRSAAAAILALISLALILCISFVIQGFIIYDVWMNPTMHLALNRAVCVLSISSMAFWLILMMPRRVKLGR